jgi:hypothetical protein
MDRVSMVAIAASLGLVACHGMTLGDALHGVGGKGSSLRGRANEMVKGPTGPAVIVQYRGGPNESLVLEPCRQCSSEWPEDLFVANGKSPGFDRARDDTDISSATGAAAGVDQVPLEAPTWCDGYQGQAKTAERIDLTPISPDTTDPAALMDALRKISWAACDRAHYAPRQKHIVDMLQAWLNVTKLPLAEVRSTLRSLASGDTVEAAGSAKDPTIEALLHCDFDGRSTFSTATYERLDQLDLLDGQDKIKSLDRAVAVCNGDAGAVSVIDMKRVDWDKAKDDLARREPAGTTRALAEKQLVALHLHVQQIMSKPDAGEVATAEAAYSEWFTKTLQPNKALFTMAFEAIARARGSEDPKGCGEGLRAEVASRLKARHFGSVKEADMVWEDPVLGVLLEAQALCDAVDRPLLGATEIDTLNVGKRWLGPRRAALLALKRNVPRLVPTHRGHTDGSVVDSFLIKSVAPQGDKLLVTFSVWQRAEAVNSCHDNSHIDRILPDGSIRYKEDCVQTGTTQVNREYAPLLVPKELADVIKPGRGAVLRLAQSNEGRDHAGGEAAEKQAPIEAYPVIVYPDAQAFKTGKPIVFYYGVRLP